MTVYQHTAVVTLADSKGRPLGAVNRAAGTIPAALFADSLEPVEHGFDQVGHA